MARSIAHSISQIQANVLGQAGADEFPLGRTLSSPPSFDALASISQLIEDITPFDAMSEHLRKLCGSFEVVPVKGRASVRGGTLPRRLGGMDGVIVSQDVERISRNVHCIRRDPGDNYFLIFQDHGHSFMCQGDLRIPMKAGDVVLIDSTKPSDFLYAGQQSQQISIHLPREEMQHRFGALILSGLGILKQDALGIAMRSILTKMLMSGDHESSHLKEAFLGVLGAALHERHGSGLREKPPINEVLLRTALQHIALKFQDPAFNAASLAASLNLTPRSLQRLFQVLGETPSRRILEARLDASFDRLRLQSSASKNQFISSVAYNCGFNDLSFFYREFRKKFGATPGHIGNPY